MDDFAVVRYRMVFEQIERRGIRDPKVLSAMRVVERHKFVSSEFLKLAYKDRPLPIGDGQTISQPYIVARMTELLKLNRGERVLEVGGGCGYQTAVLAEMEAKVYSVERIERLALDAADRLAELHYESVKMKAGDGAFGWVEAAPFDAIIVCAAVSSTPPRLIEQLRDGGRMVIPLGSGRGQVLCRVTKVPGEAIRIESFDSCLFVPFLDSTGRKV